MIFYHGTTKENWEKIKQEGILWGERGPNTSRCTYLSIEKNNARYGFNQKLVTPEILLQVKYDPMENPRENNYISGCWQFRVYEPIPISNIKVVNNE